jgi:hypothetical protein
MTKLIPFLISCLLIPSLLFSMGSKPKTQENQNEEVVEINVPSPLEAIYYMSKSLPDEQRVKNKSKLVLAYVEQGNFARAISLLKEIESMKELTIYINTINSLVAILPTENRNEKLDVIINSVQNKNKKDLTIEHIILSLIKNNDIQGVETYIPEISSRFIQARIYKYLIEYYISNGYIDEATSKYNLVQNSSEKSQVDALFVIYYAKENNIDKAQSYLNKIPNGKLRELTLSQLGKLFAENKNFNLSIQYTNEIQVQILRDETLTTLINAYVLDQKFKSAFQMSDSIQDPYFQSLGRSYLANALVEKGRIGPAKQLAESIEDDVLKSDIYYHISIYQAKNNDIEIAFSELELITDFEKKKEAVTKLAQYIGGMKEYHYALLILKKLDPEELKEIALQSFALSFIQNNPIDKSITIIKDMLSEETMISISNSYIDDGRYVDAFEFTDEVATQNYTSEIQLHIMLSSISITNTQNAQIVRPINTSLLDKYSNFEKAKIRLVNAALYEIMDDMTLATKERETAKTLLNKAKISSQKRNELISYLISIKEFDLAFHQLLLLPDKTDQIDALFQLSNKPLSLDSFQLAELKRIAQGN